MIVVPILFIGIVNLAIGCNRSGRNLLVEDRSAREIIQSFKNDFDMNVAFGLRKMGINRRSGKRYDVEIIRNIHSPTTPLSGDIALYFTREEYDTSLDSSN